MKYSEFIKRLKLYNYNDLPMYVDITGTLVSVEDVVIENEKVVIKLSHGTM